MDFFKKRVWRGVTGACAFVLACAIGLTCTAVDSRGFINAFLDVDTAAGGLDGEYYYKTAYTEDGIPSDAGLEKLLAAEDEFTERELVEGSVLLKNDGALPFGADVKKVTLFGRASADPVYRCSGGGPTINPDRTVTPKQALEGVGLEINPDLYSAYEQSAAKRVTTGDDAAKSIGEEPIGFYTQQLRGSFAEYSDAAVVILSRSGGEGTDLSRKDSEGVPALALHPSERDMLQMIRESGEFGRIVVILNSPYAMELEWLDEMGVDACLWVGATGMRGFAGVAELLVGNASPSGRLTDTYAADSLSSPAMMNFGDYTFAGDAAGTKYVVEAEGIYYGYQYYETRYEDCVYGRYGADSAVGAYASSDGWNYAEEVTYPFGYGLSYTQFEQQIVPDSFTYNEEADSFTMQVEVTNVGEAAGKEVVQVYAQMPYNEYTVSRGIEVSAIQLVGFEKTQELASGETEQISVEVPRYFLASYDDANGEEGEGGYVLQPGDYYFSVGENAHDALNNVLAAKGMTGMIDQDGNAAEGDASLTALYSLEEADTESYAVSPYTGAPVTNRFTGRDSVDINHFYDSDAAVYLTRSDWSGTYPQTVSLTINDAVSEALVSKTYSKPADAKSIAEFTQGQDGGLLLVEMRGVPFEDEKWETFLNQLTIEEMAEMVTDEGGTSAVPSVGKPAARHTDGPDGYAAKYKYGDKINCTSYASIVVLASSWNKELAKEFGEFYGEDLLYAQAQEFWGPGANLHRTPYSGRNWEYFSEDAMLTFLMSVPVVEGVNSKGGISAIKHLTANDQEINRMGIATFMTEQRLRQTCLRAFEGALAVGKSWGTMLSYNRIGCVADSISIPLNTGVIHDEWGFRGFIITDADGKENDYNPSVECLVAEVDMHCNGNRTDVIVEAIRRNDDGYLLEKLREVNHRVYYTYANTNLVNGLTEESQISNGLAWWEMAMYAIDGVIAAVTLGAVVLFVVSAVKENKRKRGGNV